MVKPLDLQVSARVEQLAGNLQLEHVQRTGAENALSNLLDATNTRLQQEQAARTAADDKLSQRLDDLYSQLVRIREEIGQWGQRPRG